MRQAQPVRLQIECRGAADLDDRVCEVKAREMSLWNGELDFRFFQNTMDSSLVGAVFSGIRAEFVGMRLFLRQTKRTVRPQNRCNCYRRYNPQTLTNHLKPP